MVHLIDKDALVAEIERRINFNEKLNAHSRLDECNAILSFLDTLEVKEVDLEKELKRLIGNVGQCDRKLAKHFYELGMSVGNKA